MQVGTYTLNHPILYAFNIGSFCLIVMVHEGIELYLLCFLIDSNAHSHSGMARVYEDGLVNVGRDGTKALACYEKALELAPLRNRPMLLRGTFIGSLHVNVHILCYFTCQGQSPYN